MHDVLSWYQIVWRENDETTSIGMMGLFSTVDSPYQLTVIMNEAWWQNRSSALPKLELDCLVWRNGNMDVTDDPCDHMQQKQINGIV